MRTSALAAASAAAALVLGLAACTGTATTPPSQQAPSASGGTPSAATTAPTPPADSPEATSPADQATADAAGQTFLRALGSGNAQGVCAVMEAEGTPIAGDQAAVERCTSIIQGILDVTKDEATQLADATVSGASVSGDKATFKNATITPELGKSVLESQTAIQVDGKWYVGIGQQ